METCARHKPRTRARSTSLAVRAVVGIGLCAAVSLPASAQQAQESTAKAPQQRKLDIWEFYVEGNTVLDTTVIEEAVEPFLGPGKTPDDIDQAR